MHYFYVLYSLKDHKLYKGSSSDLLRRIQQHNAGHTPSTKNRRPLILLYFEQLDSRSDALKRERTCKTLDGGHALKEILRAKGLINEANFIPCLDAAG